MSAFAWCCHLMEIFHRWVSCKCVKRHSDLIMDQDVWSCGWGVDYDWSLNMCFVWWALPHLKGWLLSIDSLMVGEFSNVWESWCQELEMRAKSCPQNQWNQRSEKSLKLRGDDSTMVQLLMFYWNPSESNMNKTSSFAFMNLLSRACWTRGRGEEDEWFW